MASPTPDMPKGQHTPFWKHQKKSYGLGWNKTTRRLIWLIIALLAIYALSEFSWTTLQHGLAKRKDSSAKQPKVAPRVATSIDFSDFDSGKAMQEVRDFVSLGPRVAGTDGARDAADHIFARLKSYGCNPRFDEFTAPAPGGDTLFRNVIVHSPRADGKFLLLISHYDTKSGIADDFSGANDSGSSTGLLLEMARATRNQAGISFAFVDGEECKIKYNSNDGLHGSRHLLETLSQDKLLTNVLAVIVLDMIGDKDLSVTFPPNSTPSLASMALSSAAEENVRLKFSLGDGPGIDDHTPFFDAQLPSLDIIDFQYGSKPGKNDYWHTPQDTIDKLSVHSLETVGRVTLRTINKVFAYGEPLPVSGRP